jgi:hypothetical protein
VGNSGSGKSYLLSQILGRVGLIEKSKIWLADYKNSGDFGEFDPQLHRYYARDDYTAAIEEFSELVTARIDKEDLSRDLRVLVLEEYGAYLNSISAKAESERVRKLVANMLYLARFTNSFIFICSQRIFAEHLIFGSRDSICNSVLMADPSSESLQAFTTAEERKLMTPKQQGEGYLIREGKKPLGITVSTITRPEKLRAAILRAVTKDESELDDV